MRQKLKILGISLVFGTTVVVLSTVMSGIRELRVTPNVAPAVVRGVAIEEDYYGNDGSVMRGGYTFIVIDIVNDKEIARQTLGDDGRFEFQLHPGEYRIESRGLPHWYYRTTIKVAAGQVLELKARFTWTGPPEH